MESSNTTPGAEDPMKLYTLCGEGFKEALIHWELVRVNLIREL